MGYFLSNALRSKQRCLLLKHRFDWPTHILLLQTKNRLLLTFCPPSPPAVVHLTYLSGTFCFSLRETIHSLYNVRQISVLFFFHFCKHLSLSSLFFTLLPNFSIPVWVWMEVRFTLLDVMNIPPSFSGSFLSSVLYCLWSTTSYYFTIDSFQSKAVMSNFEKSAVIHCEHVAL